MTTVAILDIDLDGFLVRSQDLEQMPGDINPGKNDPTPWSAYEPLSTMVERITDNGFLLQIYGTVLTMTGGPNHFGIITIAQHVILNGTPDRIITYEISNQGE